MDNQITGFPWYDLQWFMPGMFQNFQWESAYFLYLIPVVPLLFLLKALIGFKANQKLPVALPSKMLKTDWSSILRFIPSIFLMLSMILILVALARPQKSNEKVDQWTEGIDIMLIIDISESMQMQDFTPNRLEAAKKVATEFINGRFQDRIGVVVFSGEAYSLAPLTSDYKLLSEYIQDINFEMIESRGTAIGSALAVATNRMIASDSKSKVAILLSDGDNTAGNLDPETSARLANAYNIKLYTIAVGKEGRVPFGKDFFGRPRYVENNLDETTLRKIAEIGSGKFYRVTDNEALQSVFEEIDSLEKVEIKETRYKDTTDFYQVYLLWAMILFLAWLLLKSTFMTNILQD
jgi:Ca-activated chloride channel family protein